MSNAEHLIENAICTIEANQDYEDFASQKYNIEMAKTIGVDLEEIWTMAGYVMYTLRPIWVSDIIGVIQGEEPFHPYMAEYVKQFLEEQE